MGEEEGEGEDEEEELNEREEERGVMLLSDLLSERDRGGGGERRASVQIRGVESGERVELSAAVVMEMNREEGR